VCPPAVLSFLSCDWLVKERMRATINDEQLSVVSVAILLMSLTRWQHKSSSRERGVALEQMVNKHKSQKSKFGNFIARRLLQIVKVCIIQPIYTSRLKVSQLKAFYAALMLSITLA
jgi:hypothetical protein